MPIQKIAHFFHNSDEPLVRSLEWLLKWELIDRVAVKFALRFLEKFYLSKLLVLEVEDLYTYNLKDQYFIRISANSVRVDAYGKRSLENHFVWNQGLL